MDPLTWTGSLSFLNPIFLVLWAALAVAVVAQIVTSLFAADMGGASSVIAASSTDGRSSRLTVGAPTLPTGTTNASSSMSSGAISGTGP